METPSPTVAKRERGPPPKAGRSSASEQPDGHDREEQRDDVDQGTGIGHDDNRVGCERHGGEHAGRPSRARPADRRNPQRGEEPQHNHQGATDPQFLRANRSEDPHADRSFDAGHHAIRHRLPLRPVVPLAPLPAGDVERAECVKRFHMNPAGVEHRANEVLADWRVLPGWQQAPVGVVQLAPPNGQVVVIGRSDPVHLIDMRPHVVEAEQAEPADDPQQQQRRQQDLDEMPLPSRSSIVHGASSPGLRRGHIESRRYGVSGTVFDTAARPPCPLFPTWSSARGIITALGLDREDLGFALVAQTIDRRDDGLGGAGDRSQVDPGGRRGVGHKLPFRARHRRTRGTASRHRQEDGS